MILNYWIGFLSSVHINSMECPILPVKLQCIDLIMNTTQFFISFAIIMMLLSLVSERLANFIKLYFQGKKLYIPFVFKEDGKWYYFLEVELKVLAYKQPTEMAEKEREYRVMIINILVGILIATLADGNFFNIIRDISKEPQNHTKTFSSLKGILYDGFSTKLVLGTAYMFFFLWSVSLVLFSRLQEFKNFSYKVKYMKPLVLWFFLTIILFVLSWLLGEKDILSIGIKSIVINTIGYTITGLFLSLGSKFWHDLLDILFKFKNTQQVLSDPKTYKDYDSADKLIFLVETPQYEIAEGLFALYKSQISEIQGVVSYGLNTLLDENTKLFKKIIEVEFIEPEAQGKLDRLKFSGSITLNFNVFYLKDYMVLKRTSQLVAISSIDDSPICFAYNNHKGISEPLRGSFTVYEENGNYFATSNLHVFAHIDEFSNYRNNDNYNPKYRTVQFVIEGQKHEGTIVDYIFGNYKHKGYGIDYSRCEVKEELYDLYRNHIDVKNLKDVDLYTMKMFGATSKEVTFHSFRNPTTCRIRYKTFTKELDLYKIAVSSSYIKNIAEGDSGSTIYFKEKVSEKEERILTGILVAKSDHYAYMFIE